MYCISMNAFAKSSQFINERNFCGHKCRRRLAHQFCGGVIGHDHRNAAHHQGMENLLDRNYGLVGTSSENDAVGPIEIVDGASSSKKNRLGYYDCFQPGSM